MIDQESIDKELSIIFDGNYNANREREYTLSDSEIARRFGAIFENWDKLQKLTQDKLIEIAANTIIPEFPIDPETIKFSLTNLHLDPIKNAVLEKLSSTYLAKYYVRQIALNKNLYPELIEHIKTNLEKGVYGYDSIEIAKLLGIEVK